MEFRKLLKNIYIKNLVLFVFIFFLLIFCLKWWLSVYTHHGQAVVVPNVKGLKIEQAATFFKDNELRFEVVDSVYNKSSIPGVIVETIPAAGTKVKKNKNIYITINAYSSQTGIVPDVKDQSRRQAVAKLNAAGFKNVQVKYIPAAYGDLVLGLEYQGSTISPGARLPLDSRFLLLVGDGAQDADEFENLNSTETPSVDDSWFH